MKHKLEIQGIKKHYVLLQILSMLFCISSFMVVFLPATFVLLWGERALAVEKNYPNGCKECGNEIPKIFSCFDASTGENITNDNFATACGCVLKNKAQYQDISCEEYNGIVDELKKIGRETVIDEKVEDLEILTSVFPESLIGNADGACNADSVVRELTRTNDKQTKKSNSIGCSGAFNSEKDFKNYIKLKFDTVSKDSKNYSYIGFQGENRHKVIVDMYNYLRKFFKNEKLRKSISSGHIKSLSELIVNSKTFWEINKYSSSKKIDDEKVERLLAILAAGESSLNKNLNYPNLDSLLKHFGLLSDSQSNDQTNIDKFIGELAKSNFFINAYNNTCNELKKTFKRRCVKEKLADDEKVKLIAPFYMNFNTSNHFFLLIQDKFPKEKLISLQCNMASVIIQKTRTICSKQLGSISPACKMYNELRAQTNETQSPDKFDEFIRNNGSMHSDYFAKCRIPVSEKDLILPTVLNLKGDSFSILDGLQAYYTKGTYSGNEESRMYGNSNASNSTQNWGTYSNMSHDASNKSDASESLSSIISNSTNLSSDIQSVLDKVEMPPSVTAFAKDTLKDEDKRSAIPAEDLDKGIAAIENGIQKISKAKGKLSKNDDNLDRYQNIIDDLKNQLNDLKKVKEERLKSQRVASVEDLDNEYDYNNSTKRNNNYSDRSAYSSQNNGDVSSSSISNATVSSLLSGGGSAIGNDSVRDSSGKNDSPNSIKNVLPGYGTLKIESVKAAMEKYNPSIFMTANEFDKQLLSDAQSSSPYIIVEKEDGTIEVWQMVKLHHNLGRAEYDYARIEIYKKKSTVQEISKSTLKVPMFNASGEIAQPQKTLQRTYSWKDLNQAVKGNTEKMTP